MNNADTQRKALASIRLSWAPTPDDVWRDQTALHVPQMHESTRRKVLDSFEDAKASTDSSPIGIVVQGRAGTGKTHLLGQVREDVQKEGGYFFLIGLLDASSFWQTVLVGMLDDLARPGPTQDSQLREFLWRLASDAHISRADRRAIIGESALTPELLTGFVNAIYKIEPNLVKSYQPVLRALVLSASADLSVYDIGRSFLQSSEEMDGGSRKRWGIPAQVLTEEIITRHISRLLAATGPSVLAIDQIDTLLAQSRTGTEESELESEDSLLVDRVAHGLMSLRENLARTATVVSCLPSAWINISKHAATPARDRFRVTTPLTQLESADSARILLERRFATKYDAAHFTPPYPTWPVTDSALAEAVDYTPRQLLVAVDKHIQSCLDNDTVAELETLGSTVIKTPLPPKIAPPEVQRMDEQFAKLKSMAVYGFAVSEKSEDSEVPTLLNAGLSAWMLEAGVMTQDFELDPPPSSKPGLHARLRQLLDAATEDEQHWAFRAIAAEHHTAALNRVRAACTTAGLASGVSKRKLVIFRNAPWSKGPATQKVIKAFEAAGGRTLSLTEDDVRTLSALRAMKEENSPSLAGWLTSRRPAHSISALAAALDFAVETAAPPTESAESSAPAAPAIVTSAEPVDATPVEAAVVARSTKELADSIPLGVVAGTDTKARVDLEALRKHTAIFAGSGSGKTVLIRRLVEECALQGVSAIVLDPNNDLARLGLPWPEAPSHWDAAEKAKAADYIDNTEVIVWTPRKSAGRPLSFQPLPDFAAVRDSPDEFEEAVDAGLGALTPRALATGQSASATRSQAVLREALAYFGRSSGRTLTDFVDLLSELPDNVSGMKNSAKIAANLAENLRAAMVTDPMFGGDGTPIDPGVLLTPSKGFRARVSVVSFTGLPSDEQRQSFVNQLQMALFAWIKKNPAGDKPLGGLFVMDEAQTLAPSGAMTACTQSTLALASQARKYGLGLVFATQAPKGLNNRIPGNSATQFFGLLNSPIQIEAAKDMARAKGSNIDGVGKLKTGQFYAAVEGAEFNLLQTPLCLSYHPKSPLTSEEVVELAHATNLK